MKLTVVKGSPREDGVSANIADRIIEGAKDAGYDIVEYNINHMAIAGCQGCGSCRANNIDCVIEDDMPEYFKDLRESDMLLITAPNYYSQIAGPMITFMNRHFCLLDSSKTPRLEPGRKVIGVFAQGAPEDYDYSSVYDWYMGVFGRFGFENKGYLVAGGDSDITDNGDIMTRAYQLGKGEL